MKKTLALFVLIFLSSTLAVSAVTSTESAKSASSSGAAEIVNKITDKVAKLGSNAKKAYSGTVRSLGKSSINLLANNTEVFVDTNEITDFYRIRSGAQSTIEFKNLKVSDDLSVIGIYDEASKTLTAKQIVNKTLRNTISGFVSVVTKNGVNLEGTNQTAFPTTVDLSSSTTMWKLDSKYKLARAKATDPTKGDYISIIGYVDPESPNVFTSLRFVLIPQDLLTVSETPTSSPSAK